MPEKRDDLSCRPDTLHLTRNRSAAGAGSRPRHGSEEAAVPSKPLPDTLVYVSAVEFPEDYDWQRDTAYGTVPCRVSLFLEGERILSVPAGPGTFVGADPDRMRIREGHYSGNLDPFDRLLIAQAKTEECVLLSHDRNFENYLEKCIFPV